MTDPIRCISAALSVQSPFTMKAQRDYDAMTARQKLNSDHGDPLTLLNAYDEWISVSHCTFRLISLGLMLPSIVMS